MQQLVSFQNGLMNVFADKSIAGAAVLLNTEKDKKEAVGRCLCVASFSINFNVNPILFLSPIEFQASALPVLWYV